MKPIKVLHVIGLVDPAYGGPAVGVVELCEALAGRDVEVTLATTNRAYRDASAFDGRRERDGFEIRQFRCHRPRSYNTSPLLARYLAESAGKVDLVHIHSIYGFHTIAAAGAALRARTPFVIEPHGSLTRYHHSQKRWKKNLHETLIDFPLLRRAAAIRCASVAEMEDLVSLGLGSRAFVVPHGVAAPSRPEPDTSQTRNSLRPSILYMARITQKKRLPLTVEAFAEAAELIPDIELRIAGTGDPQIVAAVRDRIEELGLADRVHFLGGLFGDARWTEYFRAKLCVLLSEDESFGLTAIEALAAGCPVVATKDVASVRELTRTAAVRFAEPEPVAAADALISALLDSKLTKLAIESAPRIRREYSWDRIAEELHDAYAQIIDQ